MFQGIKPWLIEAGNQTERIIPSLEQLQRLPVGSLGRSFAEFLQTRHLQAIAFGPRRAQVHDVVHTLLAADIDLVGELQVQWFLAGAKPQFFNFLVGCYFLCRTSAWSQAIAAYRRGRHSCFDPDTFPVEQFWHLPLNQVRQLYGL